MSVVPGVTNVNTGAITNFSDTYTICGDFICDPSGHQVAVVPRAGHINDSSGLIFMGAGAAVGAADIATGESGILFGTVKNGMEGGGLLNRADYLRIGWSALRSGGARFRIGGDLIEDIFGEPHINLWPPS